MTATPTLFIIGGAEDRVGRSAATSRTTLTAGRRK